MMVKFDNEDSGMEMRRCHPQYTAKFPNSTPIHKQAHKYTTSKSSRGVKSNTATVFQFPLILSFASTTHKIQGQTITTPRKAAVDLRSVFGPNQAYVMLGRVQERSQLFIMGSLPVNKITTDKEALDQLAILKARSINNNPPLWEQDQGISTKVFAMNICSLRDKIEDIKADQLLQFGDAAILSETWLDREVSEEDLSLQLNGYKLHLNSYGRGKGLAIYYKENIFQPIKDCQREFLQITVIRSEDLTVVGLYRSAGDRNLAADLKKVVPTTGPCLVIGDFNICSAKSPNHEVFKSLKSMGFKLLTQEATHFEGGHIDQAWLKSNSTSNIQLYSPYYTYKDHDGLLFTIQGTEKGSILCLLF